MPLPPPLVRLLALTTTARSAQQTATLSVAYRLPPLATLLAQARLLTRPPPAGQQQVVVLEQRSAPRSPALMVATRRRLEEVVVAGLLERPRLQPAPNRPRVEPRTMSRWDTLIDCCRCGMCCLLCRAHVHRRKVKTPVFCLVVRAVNADAARFGGHFLAVFIVCGCMYVRVCGTPARGAKVSNGEEGEATVYQVQRLRSRSRVSFSALELVVVHLTYHLPCVGPCETIRI
mgnify:CR=1 FL=1